MPAANRKKAGVRGRKKLAGKARAGGGVARVKKGRRGEKDAGEAGRIETGMRSVGSRIESARRAISRARKRLAAPGEHDLVKTVHEMRVACRRAAAAISAYEPMLPGKATMRAKGVLKRVRKAAGMVRDLDVLRSLLGEWIKDGPRELRAGHRRVLKGVEGRAKKALERAELAEELDGKSEARLRKLARKVEAWCATAGEGKGKRGGAAWRVETGFARRRMGESVGVVMERGAGELGEDEAVHGLRIAIKKLRYTLEAFSWAIEATRMRRLLGEVTHLQEVMGAFNDASVLEGWIRKTLRDEDERRGAGKKSKKGAAASGGEKDAKQKMVEAHGARVRELREGAVKAWKEFAGSKGWKEVAAWVEVEKKAERGKTEGTKAEMVKERGSMTGIVGVGEVEPKLMQRGASGGTGLLAGTSLVSGTRLLAEANNGVHGGLNGGLNGAARVKESGSGKVERVRLAAIDVGTNSLRLIIAEAGSDGSYRVLDDEKETTRLGRGMEESGRMEGEAIEHSVAAIRRMASIARGYHAARIEIVGTAACREAKNAGELADKVRAATGIPMRIISAAEEAMYAYRSAARAFDLSSAPALVVDIGGGSTEVVLSVGRAGDAGGERVKRGEGSELGVVDRVYTIPIGAVRLSERFGPEPRGMKGLAARFEKIEAYARKTIKEGVGKAAVWPQVFVGTGGTLTSLASMLIQRDVKPGGSGVLFTSKVQGFEVLRADLKHLIEQLSTMTLKQRQRVAGLSAERADIIVPGLMLVDALLKRFGCNTLRVHEGGIRDGLLRSMAAEHFGHREMAGGTEASGEAVMRGVRRFARACNYERAHSEHVAGLSLRIFDQLKEAAEAGAERPVKDGDEEVKGAGKRSGRGGLGKEAEGLLTARSRVLLEAAAVLHDVGYLINYAQHHKHSYHLIIHADLPGLTTREVRVVANVARYHRANGPKVKHENFRELGVEDRRLAKMLAGILRIADGLDRTHSQGVTGVWVGIARGGVEIRVESASEPTVDLWGAHRKSDVLEGVLGKRIGYEWQTMKGMMKAGGREAQGRSEMKDERPNERPDEKPEREPEKPVEKQSDVRRAERGRAKSERLMRGEGMQAGAGSAG